MDGWREALCTPVFLGLLQGRLPRRLRPGRRARCQKLHCSPLISSIPCRSPTPPMRLPFFSPSASFPLFVDTFCGNFLWVLFEAIFFFFFFVIFFLFLFSFCFAICCIAKQAKAANLAKVAKIAKVAKVAKIAKVAQMAKLATFAICRYFC